MAGLREEAAAPVDFDEGMRAAEAEAGIPSDAELYGPQFAEPPVDDAGRVPSTSPPRDDEGNPVDTPPPAEPETPVAEPVPMQEPLAADELAELKRKVGQMANENAELRRWQEEQSAQPAPQYMPDQQAMSWFDDALEQAPDQATVWAAQQQQPLLYERAIRAWNDVDPVAANRYERLMEMGQLQQQLAAQLQPQIQGAQELAQRSDMNDALNALRAKHDDFDLVVGPLDEAKAQALVEDGLPVEVLNGLFGSRADKERTLNTVYKLMKADRTEPLVAGAVEAVQASREEAKAAKRAATVASASTASPEQVEESEGERLARVWKEQRPSMRDAWKR